MKASNVIRFPIERVQVRHAIEALFTAPEYVNHPPLTREAYLAVAYPNRISDCLSEEIEAANPEESR